jgi:glyoxylase-like metal-dependent hydrolase (beta-lactamase superfamily II)
VGHAFARIGLLAIAAAPLASLAQTPVSSAAPASGAIAIADPRHGHEVTQIAPGYYSLRYHANRNVFWVTSRGVIATDPGDIEQARVLREEIRKITPLPVKYVIYSHQHWDHVIGGAIFKQEGAKFVSHENCARHFRDLPNKDIVMPDITFTSDKYLVRLGERRITLRYLGPNHGDCLIVMTPDNADIPFIVDLATAGGMPLSFMADYSLHHWVRSLRELEGWSFQQYVGGHGVPLAPKSRLTERREYLEALMTETRRELAAGTPDERIPDLVAGRLRGRFEHLRGFDGIVRDNVRRTLTYYAMGW